MRPVVACLAAAGLPLVQTYEVVQLDLFRAMTGASAAAHPTEDNDIADLGGVLKYIHTELLTEHLADPLRKYRKYNVDAIRKQRYKVRNPDSLLDQTPFPDFGEFITYDWGEATNKAQLPLMEKFGDFVGIQSGCSGGRCDPRYPSSQPYNWFSAGNWCPNLRFDMKGSKLSPNPACLKHRGQPLMGGLCPGGDDSVNLVPLVEPTGQPGCVYSYGKPSLLSLDELVGITKEDCAGGMKCKDWIHFRNNCTNATYKRQYTPSGQIKTTTYCVEYDIHPLCAGDCSLPACQSLIKSGSVELGLPFWQGRCDELANRRRLEVTAYSWGITGSLDWHQTIDPAVLQSNTPCVHMRSGSCKANPLTGGPYCTRSMTAVCEICYIPNTKLGSVPTPKPWCPFDILESVDYKNRTAFPRPTCRSNMTEDLCCLYTKSCSHQASVIGQETPTEIDFVQALYARSTAAMEGLLRMAASSGLLSVGPGDSVTLRRAAYEMWSHSPSGASLQEALASVQRFLTAPPPQLSPAHVVMEIKTSTAGSYCFEEEVAFFPLDMEGTVVTQASDAWACQDRCAQTKGCAHFSYSSLPGLDGQCHLQHYLAIRVPRSLGFTSGPAKCWLDLSIREQQGLIVRPHETYLPKTLACLELRTGYFPPLVVSQPQPLLKDLSLEQKVAACERYCSSVPTCRHFSLLAPLGCTLAGEGATKLLVEGTASGQPGCGVDTTSSSLQRKFSASTVPQPPVEFPLLYLACIAAVAVAVLSVAGFGGRRLASRSDSFNRSTYRRPLGQRDELLQA